MPPPFTIGLVLVQMFLSNLILLVFLLMRLNDLSFSSDRPALNCLHPRYIYNASLGQGLYVPCRHCVNCLNSKADFLSLRIQDECKFHRYSLFFTLTYDNEHLPLLLFKKIIDSNYYFESNRIGSGGVVDSLLVPYFDFPRPQGFSDDCFAYSCKRDIQLFFKRLRKSLSKITHEKIRYFVVSEYGPSTFRPHYHGILWFDERPTFEFLTQNSREEFGCSASNPIFAAWKNCSPRRVEVSQVSGSAAQYVANYCTSFSNLPPILQTKLTLPFHLASKNPIVGFDKSNSFSYLLDCLYRRDITLPQHNNSSLSYSQVPDKLSLETFNHFIGFPSRFSLYNYRSFLLLLKKYSNPSSLNKNLSGSNFNFDYYLHNDSYLSQDHYFVRKFNSFLNRTFNLIDGTPVSFDSFSLFSILTRFKTQYFTLSLYSHCHSISDSFSYWIAHINEVPDFPERCSCSRFLSLFHCQKSDYDFLYTNNHLDTSIIDKLFSHNLVDSTVRVKHKNSTKVYNNL